jgi:S-DNA-T family DNA segregation ATPase FtsK/SpoIIIE
VGLGNLLDSEKFKKAESPLTFATGINYNGKIVLTDIEELPHMLVAGTTGSGKTVFMDDLILSILYKATPEQVRMIMIDPKMVDLTFYNGIPHLLAPVVYEENKIFGMLDWVESEMMRRYEKFSRRNVKNIQIYNTQNGEEMLPQILVIIDEYSELMMDYGAQFEAAIDRIGRLGRAAGIHLVIATQRATADVITNSIKSNLTCRASFTVIDWRESNAIINKAGARHLCGAGDMLFAMNSTVGMEHVQAPLVTEKEIKDVVKYVSQSSIEGI